MVWPCKTLPDFDVEACATRTPTSQGLAIKKHKQPPAREQRRKGDCRSREQETRLARVFVGIERALCGICKKMSLRKFVSCASSRKGRRWVCIGARNSRGQPWPVDPLATALWGLQSIQSGACGEPRVEIHDPSPIYYVTLASGR